jgi:hypothetical protein
MVLSLPRHWPDSVGIIGRGLARSNQQTGGIEVGRSLQAPLPTTLCTLFQIDCTSVQTGVYLQKFIGLEQVFTSVNITLH